MCQEASCKINVWGTFINKNLISIIHTAGCHLLARQVQRGHCRNINMYSIICQQRNNVSKSFRTDTDLQLFLPAANYDVLGLFGMAAFIGKWQKGNSIPDRNIDGAFSNNTHSSQVNKDSCAHSEHLFHGRKMNKCAKKTLFNLLHMYMCLCEHFLYCMIKCHSLQAGTSALCLLHRPCMAVLGSPFCMDATECSLMVISWLSVYI